MVKRVELEHFLNQYLEIKNFSDYGPNGLQVEGKEEIRKIAFAVSATRASIAESIKQKADTLIVHHGLFWKFHGSRTLTGPFAGRVLPLVRNEINLFGYHLPLDAHYESGNAATLGNKIDLVNQEPFGDYKGAPLGVKGGFVTPPTATDLKNKLESVLNHPVILASPDPDAKIESLGIITGGANGQWKDAAADGLDAYLTGEMSEHDWHESQEAGIHMFAGGHHATEQFGIQTLMGKVSSFAKVECFYIDSANPA
jgi:dinuclear metal center YbgI/SA1388 family protein